MRLRYLDELGPVVAVRRDALGDRGELLEGDAGDRLEVRAAGSPGACRAEAGLRLVLRHLRLRGGLLGGGHLLRLGRHLLALGDHVGRGIDHVAHVFHPPEHSHGSRSPPRSVPRVLRHNGLNLAGGIGRGTISGKYLISAVQVSVPVNARWSALAPFARRGA